MRAPALLGHYGWRPDLPDQRDHLFLPPEAVVLPPSVDLRAGCSPVEDQGQLGSCTAQAIVGALEFLERTAGGPFHNLSRLFVYYNERVLEHTVLSDAGAAIRDGMKTILAQGVCTEPKWPYTVSKFAVKPPPSCYADGLKRTATSYTRLTSHRSMQACLAASSPFVFGFTVYESFESAAVERTGQVPLPGATEQVLGGHAVLCVGYDDATQRFLVRNSWGTAWGVGGYGTMPYAYLANPSLASDFWAVR